MNKQRGTRRRKWPQLRTWIAVIIGDLVMATGSVNAGKVAMAVLAAFPLSALADRENPLLPVPFNGEFDAAQ